MGMLDDSMYGHCPDLRLRFLDELGDGFLFGLAGASAFHFFKDLRDSPNGGRLAGAAGAVRANAPRVAGSFAAFWGVWSFFDSAMLLARRKDPWNSIVAGAAASGVVVLRRGARVAACHTLVGGTFFALIEGASIVLSNTVFAKLAARTPDDGPDLAEPLGDPPKPGGFMGIPPGPPIVVEEFPAADLGY